MRRPDPSTVTPISRPRTVNTERVNGYVCRNCKRVTWTIDVDEGVTPMFLRCRVESGCLGMAASMFYMVPKKHPEPVWEWYRPTEADAVKQERLWPGSMQHWKQSGLSLRRRQQVGSAPVEGGVT